MDLNQIQANIIEEYKGRLFTQIVDNRILFHTRINLLNHGHVVKKNNRPIWRGPKLGKSPKLIAAEKHINGRLFRERVRLGWRKPIDRPVWCMFLFYFKNYYVKKKRKADLDRINLRNGDLSNLYQLPEDCLVESKILADDALICSHDGSRKLQSDKGFDYLDIFILEYGE